MNWQSLFNTAYSLPATLFLSLVGLACTFLLWELIKKLKISIDRRLALAVFPWALFTSGLRVLQDAGILHSFLLTSPWLYLLALVFVAAYLVLLYKLRKRDYWKISFFTATAGFLLLLSFLRFSNFQFLAYFTVFFLPWFFFLYSFFKQEKLSKENFLVLLSQLYDANVTAVSIQYFGYVSKHMVPTAITLLGGPFSFIFVKFFAILLILLLLDRKIKEKNLRNYIKLLVAVFGIFTGTRDLLRAAVSV